VAEQLIIDFISTGDEVLTGEIDDTNASWISRFLLEQGLLLSRRYTVADNLDELVAVFSECSRRADIVIVNGGLGPTEDDLSAAALATALGQPLVIFDDWVQQMRAKYLRINRVMSPANLKQALLPQGIDIIDNLVGTACGFQVQHHRAMFYFTPGVPHEFKTMLRGKIWSDLSTRFNLPPRQIVRKFFTYGYGESDLVGMLQPLQLPPAITLGYRAAMPFIEIKLTAAAGPELDARCVQLKQLLGERLLYCDDSSLAAEIQRMMIAAGKTLALAESCTGGLAASTLIAEPGSSAYFDRGFVTYSWAAKCELLGVVLSQLEQSGAVSETVAAAMAAGALNNSAADIALSITGVAGPNDHATPAGELQPKGRVVFSLAVRGGYTTTLVCQFRYRSRTQIRQMAATFALDMLRRYLSDLPVKSDLNYLL
jgi:nicotinamide-nucleotide amidase|tara:strand:- start:523 stop:1803 length:1281 start_codon:yes stop_codon:yes gene_type:complete